MIKAIAFLPNSPTLIGDIGIDHSKTIDALVSLGREIKEETDSVVIMTPHFQTAHAFGIIASNHPKQIFDFYGFPEDLYKIKYEPPGNPELAAQIVKLGLDSNIEISPVKGWGLDHGAWSPLVHLFKDAEIPVVPISICPDLGPEAHVFLGRLMRSSSIKSNLCILATGSLIHRLDLFQTGDNNTPPEALEFMNRCISSFQEGNWDSIWNSSPDIVRAAAPEGNNLPLRFIEGAVGEKFSARILASEMDFGSASLTTVTFKGA